MSDYLRIARTYLHATPVAVWCFMLFCLFTYAVVGDELARNQSGILGGVLSRKSYMAMFAYFNACVLGVLVRDNIAHSWASLLPHYRQKHLLVTTLIALVFLATPMFLMSYVGNADVALTSVAVIFLASLAAGLWTLHHPALGFLAIPFLVFVMVPSASSPQLTAFLVGTNPVASAALAMLSLLALGVLAWRLLVLNEETLEYVVARMWGDLLRGRGQISQGKSKAVADYLTTLPADQRAGLQTCEAMQNWFTNLKQVDELSGYTHRSLWQRLQLWRWGTAQSLTVVSVAGLVAMTLFLIPLGASLPRSAGMENPARDMVVIFSVQVMVNPFSIWLPWIIRRHRMGYESLRPRTRQEFIRELGLAFMWDITVCWLGGVLLMGISAAMWAPELLQMRSIILLVSCTAVGQLGAYAIAAWPLKRGVVTSIWLSCGAFLAIEAWMLFFVMNDGINFEVKIATASLLAAISVAAIGLSYRRWCQADLD